MWRRWHKPPIEWYPTGHMGFIAHIREALRSVRAFIDACPVALLAAPSLTLPHCAGEGIARSRAEPPEQ